MFRNGGISFSEFLILLMLINWFYVNSDIWLTKDARKYDMMFVFNDNS